jgi:hypothetical protein
MLLNSRSDLQEHKNEPMVFPVFGRGRLLDCLFGENISEKNLQGAISFLAASCSCDVKQLDFGMNLLIGAPWDRAIMDYFSDDASLPELTGVMPGPRDSVKRQAADHDKTKKNISVLVTCGIALGSVMVAVIFAGLIINRRRKRD